MKKWIQGLVLASVLLTGCSNSTTTEYERLSSEPHGVYYEIFVRAFADSDGDGIGDINGIIDKLDYLEDLGIEGIWLMPINPSPSYHGYDVTDYLGVDEEYGTIDDMKRLVEEANKKGIKIVMDFVINHSSKDHPWFQKALTGDEEYRDYYVWADEETNTNQTGDWAQTVWYGSGNNIYEGVFWDGMPDLNFDSPKLRQEIIDAGTFWLKEIGVDGFRLDAAKYLYSSYQYSDHHDRNVAFWKEFKSEMEAINPDVMMVGEVWDSASVVGPYLEGLHSGFNFDLSEKILSTVKQESDAGIVSNLTRTIGFFEQVNKDYIDSTFITNHDMNRVMTEVQGDHNKAKMAASLLLTLPGNPYIYYGEETGLEGSKPDEYIREPFIWNSGEAAKEQTSWITSKHNQDKEVKSLEAQLDDENSMYTHYRDLINARRGNLALIEGALKSTSYRENGLVTFKRQTDKEEVLVLHNVSKKAITIALDDADKEFNQVYFASFDQSKVTESIDLPPYSTLILLKK
ncbi:alpha-amylase family glycosyl hydrolase [Bacillus sp. PS06]|uniref:alpha-amylase family glycosyl hydrolase n=1 Tax=Bacillus sp. PS06 TaxID=2764176 RepID=UPI00178345FD|nr:alpha-amylase family glycosyl hydrolase [Bacillus sp. PS06]MBD8069540.1 alpha-amylase [Bacillus sp. PS06]